MMTRNLFHARRGVAALLLLCAATAFPRLGRADSITFAAPTITLHESGSVQTGYFDILITNSADSNTTGGAGDTPYAESQGYGPGVTNTTGSDVITGTTVEVTTTGGVTFLNADDQTQAATVGGTYNYLYSTDSVLDSPYGSNPTAGNLIFGPQDVAFNDVPADLGPTLTAGTPQGLMRIEYSIPANYAGTVPLIIVPATDPTRQFRFCVERYGLQPQRSAYRKRLAQRDARAIQLDPRRHVAGRTPGIPPTRALAPARPISGPLMGRRRALIPALLAALAVACAGNSLRADIFTFDDLPTPSSGGSPVPDGYGGMDWSNFYYLNGDSNIYNPSGYQNGVVSPDNDAFNGFGTTAMTMAGGGTFTFDSAYFTAAWNDGLQVSVQGYNGATLLDSTLFTVNTSGPVLETFNWMGINEARLQQFWRDPKPRPGRFRYALRDGQLQRHDPGAIQLGPRGHVVVRLLAFGRLARSRRAPLIAGTPMRSNSLLVPPRMGFNQVSMGFAAVILLLAAQAHAAGLGDINSATDTVGVDPTGALYDGTTGVGFLRNSDGFDPLAPGTPRDSWGVSAGTVSGQADPYYGAYGGTENLVSNGSSISGGGTIAVTSDYLNGGAGNLLLVTQDMSFVAGNVLQIAETITNVSGSPQAVEFARDVDEDIAPTEYDEVTKAPGVPLGAVANASYYGFENPSPLVAYTHSVGSGGTFGPADLGGGILLNLGTLPSSPLKIGFSRCGRECARAEAEDVPRCAGRARVSHTQPRQAPDDRFEKIRRRGKAAFLLQAPRRAHAEQFAHDQTQIARRLVIGSASRLLTLHATNNVSLRLSRTRGQTSVPSVRCVVAAAACSARRSPADDCPSPRGVCLGAIAPFPSRLALRFRNVGAKAERLVDRRQLPGRVIALVGHCLFNVRRAFGRDHVQLGLRHALGQRLAVGPIRGVDHGRQHQIGVQIDHVFGLVRRMRRAVFHPGNPAVRVVRRLPVVVRDLLVFAGFIEPTQLFVARILQACFGCQATQVRRPVFARVAPHDALHGRVGFQHRRIDRHGLTTQQLLLGGQLEHEVEHRLVHFQRQPTVYPRQAGVVGRLLMHRHAQKLGQRATVVTPPGDAALRADSLEVADENHAKVDARRNRLAAHLGGVVGSTERFQPAVEAGFGQQRVQLFVKWVAGRFGQLRGRDPSRLLFLFAFAKGHQHASCG